MQMTPPTAGTPRPQRFPSLAADRTASSGVARGCIPRRCVPAPVKLVLKNRKLQKRTLGIVPFAPVLLAAIALVLTLSACSSSDPVSPEPIAEELKDKSKPAIDTPEAQLLADATRYFQAGLYGVAIDLFEKLRDGYPLGPYAELADIKVADANFESSNFAAAAGLYEEFLKSRPDSPAVAYVTLRAARSNQLANRGVGRDAASLQKAADLYDQLLNKFPNSAYAEGAAVYRQQVKDLLAANDKAILEFYKKRDKQQAYEARKKEFLARFGERSDEFELPDGTIPAVEKLTPAPQGTRVLVETNLTGPGQAGSGQAGSGQAGSGQAGSGQAIASGRSSETERGSTLSRSASSRSAPSGLFVRYLECNKSQRMVLVHLSMALASQGELEAQSPLTKGTLAGSAQGLTLLIPGLRTMENAATQRDCFATRDLTILPKGEIQLSTESASAEVMELSNPPRILIALR